MRRRDRSGRPPWHKELAHTVRDLDAMYINLHGGYHMRIEDVREFYRKTTEWDNPANYDEEE